MGPDVGDRLMAVLQCPIKGHDHALDVYARARGQHRAIYECRKTFTYRFIVWTVADVEAKIVVKFIRDRHFRRVVDSDGKELMLQVCKRGNWGRWSGDWPPPDDSKREGV